MKLPDLGVDSMRTIKLPFAIEDGFDIARPEEELNNATFDSVETFRSLAQRPPSIVGERCPLWCRREDG